MLEELEGSKIEITQEMKKEIEFKYKGSISLKGKNHILWEFDVDKKELNPVQLVKNEKLVVDILDKHKIVIPNRRAIFNPKAVYVSALNRKNAEKQIIKLLLQLKEARENSNK